MHLLRSTAVGDMCCHSPPAIRLFSLNDAYRVTALVNNMRVAQGYKPLGRKIGFTNCRMWDEYGVSAPNWGYVYDRTMQDFAAPLNRPGFVGIDSGASVDWKPTSTCPFSELPSTSPNELNTTLTPHSIIHGDACFAYFNKIWGTPPTKAMMVPLSRWFQYTLTAFSRFTYTAAPSRFAVHFNQLAIVNS